MHRLAITRVALKEKSNKKHLAYIMLDEKRNFVDFHSKFPLVDYCYWAGAAAGAALATGISLALVRILFLPALMTIFFSQTL